MDPHHKWVRKVFIGTRADFYVGRGENAEWLGSIGYDGYPDGINDAVLNATTEEEYRKAVTDFFTSLDHATTPEHGWPWPWNDSHLSDYAYAFDGGVVYASSFGAPWFPANKPEPMYYDSWADFDDEFAEEEREEYRSRVIIGKAKEEDCPVCGHERHPSVIHPNMADRKRVTLGKRSGMIVFGI